MGLATRLGMIVLGYSAIDGGDDKLLALVSEGTRDDPHWSPWGADGNNESEWEDKMEFVGSVSHALEQALLKSVSTPGTMNGN